jgi:uncharacterized RDD family membrane protein YckC
MSQGRPGATVTPEAVQLRADVAGLGSRSIALMVDGLIQGVLAVPVLIGFLADGIADTAETVALGLILFVILWLYFPLFEWLWGGQTPGKRAQRIRVVRTSGQPAGFAPVMVRNLLRVVEVYALPFIAVTSMFFTARGQRVGDLAAGTMVIRDRLMPAPQVVTMGEPDPRTPAFDASGLTEREYALLRTFLSRRSELDPAARQELAARLATMARGQLGELPSGSQLRDEELIEAVFRSYRARFASRSE